METLVQAPLNDLESALSTLVTQLTTSPSFANAPTTAISLVTTDDALTSTLQSLKQHQLNYARILRLREEAARLETQIKDTIRTCGSLRDEVAAVCGPEILEDSESDDEDADVVGRNVEYHTLLAFAKRIGTHNATAAKDAEDQVLRRSLEARKREAKATGTVSNGTALAEEGALRATEANAPNVISEGEQGWLNETAMNKRIIGGMAFPAAERLRLGELGQLQRLQEEGKDVEKQLEHQIARAERWSSSEKDNDVEEMMINVSDAERPSTGQPSGGAPSSARQQVPERKKSVAPLNLDLWDEDEDDDG